MTKKASKIEGLNEECIVDINPGQNPNINRDLFYMFWRIKESGMDVGLIHMEKDLTTWWFDLWDRYEKNCNRMEIRNRLVGLLKEKFTDEELVTLSELNEFKV